MDLCLYYGRTSLNSPCSSLPPRFSSVNPPYTLAIPSKSLCAHTHKGKNKNKKIMHIFHCSPQFMAAGRHKMDTFLKAWSSIGILKKQLNKGSLKPTFRWNTCSYDKHTRYYNLYASWPALMNRWKKCEMHKNHIVPIKYNPLLNSLAEQFFLGLSGWGHSKKKACAGKWCVSRTLINDII